MEATIRNPAGGVLNAALQRAERKTVEKVLARANGNVAVAAVSLGILRTSLYRIMKRYGIATPRAQDGD
jgi:transcriptional regulator of acetoin/glycerol metabolism